jgi:hypothetical protein
MSPQLSFGEGSTRGESVRLRLACDRSRSAAKQHLASRHLALQTIKTVDVPSSVFFDRGEGSLSHRCGRTAIHRHVDGVWRASAGPLSAARGCGLARAARERLALRPQQRAPGGARSEDRDARRAPGEGAVFAGLEAKRPITDVASRARSQAAIASRCSMAAITAAMTTPSSRSIRRVRAIGRRR